MEFKPFGPATVSSAVKAACGATLTWAEHEDDASHAVYAVQSLPLDDQVAERCGSFSINMYIQPPPASVRAGGEPDSDGVRWWKVAVGWVGVKYFENVEFIWSTPKHELNDQWRTLDTAFARMH